MVGRFGSGQQTRQVQHDTSLVVRALEGIGTQLTERGHDTGGTPSHDGPSQGRVSRLFVRGQFGLEFLIGHHKGRQGTFKGQLDIVQSCIGHHIGVNVLNNVRDLDPTISRGNGVDHADQIALFDARHGGKDV